MRGLDGRSSAVPRALMEERRMSARSPLRKRAAADVRRADDVAAFTVAWRVEGLRLRGSDNMLQIGAGPATPAPRR
ncbi:hypothetical protein DY468_06485 [Rhodopseudomonas sp. BR0M22]|nr:hypothetical protein [Rhodopseudomonas sp. BR0M22]